MSNLILPKGQRPAQRPRLNSDGTITIPFDTSNGQCNITFTRAGYVHFVATCDELWARMDRRQRLASDILDIERHESVV